MAAKQQLLAVLRPAGQKQKQHVNMRHRQRPPAFTEDVYQGPKRSLCTEACTSTDSLPHRQKRNLENGITEKLLLTKQCPSTYDTAWVSMVPAQGSPQTPRFPQFVQWIQQNQNDDGSWGLGNLDLSLLGKDAITSTTACILALKRWSIGNEQIMKGLHFIRENYSRIKDENCFSPVGFNLIFPRMITIGIDMGLEFPLSESDIDWVSGLREMELLRHDSVEASRRNGYYMAYVAEGLGDMQEINQALMYQRKNGSLFNSPAATAAAAIHTQDPGSLMYLDFLAEKCSSSVPTVYPMDIYSQLCLVDTLEKIGIAHHFPSEIKHIVNMVYRSWLEKDEEIIMDMETCAMAFRILRVHGYDISSDALSHLAHQVLRFNSSVSDDVNNAKALLELYKASRIRIFEDEWSLDNIESCTRKLLNQQFCSRKFQGSRTLQEGEYGLKFPFYPGTLEPAQQKWTIERYDIKHVQMRKSAFMAPHSDERFLTLAIEEFRSSQSVYQEELACIKRWAEEIGLHQLKFARVMPLDVFVFMASTVFAPELYDASIAWMKNSILTTVVDDFFENQGSIEELKNLVALIEKWDAHEEVGFCSENVEALFYAVYSTNSQIGAKAEEIQNRSIMCHIAEVWSDVVRAYMIEQEWTRERHVPTMQEYMCAAEVSIALGAIVAPSLYLVGPKLSEGMIRSSEYKDLLRHMRTSVRFLNDLGTYKKEMTHGCINSVLLKARVSDLSMSPASIETAKTGICEAIADSQRELLRLVLRDGGPIPRLCRDIFWNTYRIGQRFYSQGDGFGMPQELVAAVNAVVHEPLNKEVMLPPRKKRGYSSALV
ncbi:hypothetical protein PVAP13_2NG177700 [Panicum virgatum]|uniref:Uncharacterized protein n=1 Tax=Panicum virgatum TaxID=38727 RepID=A0A8T0VIY4_PANVG|nr:hypothetical protein PVAP13_2NG177700 [Panicum virgatum]